MDTSAHTLQTLFTQLGLESSDQAIHTFIRQHKLASNLSIQDAPFWSTAQAVFIRESLKQDADWSEVIDELNILLH
ncbi:DUF2789 domain-containing protein [Rheinheimera baltica]|uniref:DUF2789 domain-containing protein n=1 Tax=Rheinheimera baltica TaxID=67576 RepID=A0ABT9HXN9_9GAMM|nr:DUF2789 domain-containing protein [Rheinheimera baltica]MDP5135898.1 DUF2789 domain-containing protein [Rheinheimera baltica]MDP5141771.1 DUF2789 domain-containing protein [Rheinheimera baltica]